MYRVLGVSRSGYYYYRWLKRKPSRRELDNWQLDAQIREIIDISKGRYGSSKIAKELNDRGRKMSKTEWPNEFVQRAIVPRSAENTG